MFHTTKKLSAEHHYNCANDTSGVGVGVEVRIGARAAVGVETGAESGDGV